MDDSGGYTMKWRRVNPNPWAVRCKRTVLGLGHENSSSVGYCLAGEPARLLHSGDSFYTKRKRVNEEVKLNRPTFIIRLTGVSCLCQNPKNPNVEEIKQITSVVC